VSLHVKDASDTWESIALVVLLFLSGVLRGRGRGGLVLGKRVVVEGKVFLFDFN
jgi:hypothetical protein